MLIQFMDCDGWERPLLPQLGGRLDFKFVQSQKNLLGTEQEGALSGFQIGDAMIQNHRAQGANGDSDFGGEGED